MGDFMTDSVENTHTHTHIYIYILYVCVCVCVCVQQNLSLNNQQGLIRHKAPINLSVSGFLLSILDSDYDYRNIVIKPESTVEARGEWWVVYPRRKWTRRTRFEFWTRL